MDWISSRWDPIADPCKHNTEPSGPVNDREFPFHMR